MASFRVLSRPHKAEKRPNTAACDTPTENESATAWRYEARNPAGGHFEFDCRAYPSTLELTHRWLPIKLQSHCVRQRVKTPRTAPRVPLPRMHGGRIHNRLRW